MSRNATEVRKGNVLILDDGKLWAVTDRHHHTPGNLRSIIRLSIKCLDDGTAKQIRASSAESFEVAYLERRKCQYLYNDTSTGAYVFMDQEDYEQYELHKDFVGDAMNFVKEEQVVDVTFHETTPVAIDLPPSVVLTITHADPAVKGNTVSNVFKKAILETGFEIKVPHHIAPGETVKVSTTTGEFMGRAND